MQKFEKLFPKLDAVVTQTDRKDNPQKMYFISDAYVAVYEPVSGRVIEKPTALSAYWPNWPDGFWPIDSGLDYNNGYMYFFKGKEYIRIRKGATYKEHGYCDGVIRNVNEDWNNLNKKFSKIDGAVRTQKWCYFFSGDEYIRYNMSSKSFGRIHYIKTYWDGFGKLNWNSIDAVGVSAADKRRDLLFFFKGENFVQYEMDADKVTTEPTKIVHSFHGVPITHSLPTTLVKTLTAAGKKDKKAKKNAANDLKDDFKALKHLVYDGKKRATSKIDPSITQTREFKKIVSYGRANGYGVVWLGLTAEVSVFAKFEDILGIAYDIGAEETSAFSSWGFGGGLEIGAAGGLIVGFHQGNFEEFSGFEPSVQFTIGEGFGGALTIEYESFSNFHEVGFSFSFLLGIEDGISVMENYRWVESLPEYEQEPLPHS